MNNEQAGLEPKPDLLPEAGYPPRGFTFVLADGVTGLLPGSDVVKITLAVTEPNFIATESNKAVPVAQVTMPLVGFVRTSQFFSDAIENMIESGIISRERVNSIIMERSRRQT